MADFSEYFNTPNQSVDLWAGFDSYINKFIFKIREKKYMCDLIQQQNIPNGKAVRLFISQDGKYKEYFEIFYVGQDIIGQRV